MKSLPITTALLVAALAAMLPGCSGSQEADTLVNSSNGDSGASLFASDPDLAALMESGTYYNDASNIAVRFATSPSPSKLDIDKMLRLLKDARDIGETVNPDKLEAVYPTLGRSFSDLYLQGLRLRVDAIENPEKGKMQKADTLLEQWDTWYRSNADGLKAAMRREGVPV